MKVYNFQVTIEQDEDGIFIADCPALQGCHTYGETIEEAIANIKEVIELCLEYVKELERDEALKYPEIIGIRDVGVVEIS